MSAEVETMFYTREKPWHGLGTRVEDAPGSREALELAGLDWQVIQRPIATTDGQAISLASRPISEHRQPGSGSGHRPL